MRGFSPIDFYSFIFRWLAHVEKELVTEGSVCDTISWAAYHAQRNKNNRRHGGDCTSMLPLFKEQAHSPAMIKHSLTVIQKAVAHLNPNQIPVVAFDQPLYAIAKKIQWCWPDTFGDKEFIIMFGGLHIELTALKALGKWLDGSGWIAAITQAGIASSGTADSFLKASHITKTRHAHQVTVASLNILMNKAYIQYCEDTSVPMAFDMWKTNMEKKSPTFKFWSLTIKFQVKVLMYVRSIRERNFDMYRSALTNLVPLFFSLDHPNYSRWISVHINDMYLLDKNHPDVAKKFREGKFTINKTGKDFSSIAIDHAHKQNNKLVKGDGGIIGLTENSSQLLRWMVAGPEIAGLVNDFQADMNAIHDINQEATSRKHHEELPSVQNTFKEQVCQVIEEHGNMFSETSENLIVLDSRDILDGSIILTINQIEEIGKKQFEIFVEERIIKRTRSLFEPIKLNKMLLFHCPKARKNKALMQKVSSLKQNCSLFAQLYVSCQVREGNLDDFFSHENQNCPPSISQQGRLKFGQKSNLLECLEGSLENQNTAVSPDVQVKVFDGAALVNMLKPSPGSSFSEYAANVFIRYLQNQLENTDRIDLVWDRYLENSLKESTREKRGKGLRRQVTNTTKTPGNWQEFLRSNENKIELFQYLAQKAIGIIKQKIVISTFETNVICNQNAENLTSLSECNHEEADTRIFIHIKDASIKGYTKIMIRTVDTDVVVLAVYAMQQIHRLTEMWILFGVGKKTRYIPIHELCKVLTPEKCRVLPLFHALTGCDQTSAFGGRSKKTAWSAWKTFPELTDSLERIVSSPSIEDIKLALPSIERFVILLYDRGSTCVTVNEARKDLFTRKSRAIDSIPPTIDALALHVKRSIYQGSFVWGQTMTKIQSLPSPTDWGWQLVDSMWEPHWTTLPSASKACRELIKCGCNPEIGCKNRCKCRSSNLPCTSLCKCGGECDVE